MRNPLLVLAIVTSAASLALAEGQQKSTPPGAAHSISAYADLELVDGGIVGRAGATASACCAPVKFKMQIKIHRVTQDTLVTAKNRANGHILTQHTWVGANPRSPQMASANFSVNLGSLGSLMEGDRISVKITAQCRHGARVVSFAVYVVRADGLHLITQN